MENQVRKNSKAVAAKEIKATSKVQIRELKSTKTLKKLAGAIKKGGCVPCFGR